MVRLPLINWREVKAKVERWICVRDRKLDRSIRKEVDLAVEFGRAQLMVYVALSKLSD